MTNIGSVTDDLLDKALLICQSISELQAESEGCLKDNKIDWVIIQRSMLRHGVAIRAEECRNIWKFIAYAKDGDSSIDLQVDSDSDLEEAYLHPYSAVRRFQAMQYVAGISVNAASSITADASAGGDNSGLIWDSLRRVTPNVTTVSMNIATLNPNFAAQFAAHKRQHQHNCGGDIAAGVSSQNGVPKSKPKSKSKPCKATPKHQKKEDKERQQTTAPKKKIQQAAQEPKQKKSKSKRNLKVAGIGSTEEIDASALPLLGAGREAAAISAAAGNAAGASVAPGGQTSTTSGIPGASVAPGGQTSTTSGIPGASVAPGGQTSSSSPIPAYVAPKLLGALIERPNKKSCTNSTTSGAISTVATPMATAASVLFPATAGNSVFTTVPVRPVVPNAVSNLAVAGNSAFYNRNSSRQQLPQESVQNSAFIAALQRPIPGGEDIIAHYGSTRIPICLDAVPSSLQAAKNDQTSHATDPSSAGSGNSAAP